MYIELIKLQMLSPTSAVFNGEKLRISRLCKNFISGFFLEAI